MGLPGGVLNQNKNSIIFRDFCCWVAHSDIPPKFDNYFSIFALSLKKMSSSSFYVFIYAKSDEQCDLTGGPTLIC